MNITMIRGAFASVSLIAVAACSTVGGQTTPGLPAAAGPAYAHANGLGRQPVTPPSTAQRTIAGAALSIAGNSLDLDQFGSTDGGLIGLVQFGSDAVREHLRAPHAVAPPCIRGVESTWSSSGPGQVSESAELFYDAACTRLYIVFNLNEAITSASGNAQVTRETIDQSGNVTDYQTYSLSFVTGGNGQIGDVIVQKTGGPNPGLPAFQAGFTCLFDTGDAIDCGSGIVNAVQTASSNNRIHPNAVVTAPPTATPSPAAPGSVGFEQTIVGQYVSGNAVRTQRGVQRFDHSASGISFQINGAGFTGPAGALTLAQGSAPAWTIGGGTQVDTLTGTADIGFNGFQHDRTGWHAARRHVDDCPTGITSLQLTLMDTSDGLSVALTSNGNGTLIGKVTNIASGQAVATMDLNFYGNGTIAYSGGEVDRVIDWVVQ
jgi:hypothetical protein